MTDETTTAASGSLGRAIKFARGAIDGATGFLVPATCANCRTRVATANVLCVSCWGEIHFIRPPLCDRLGIPLPFDAGAGAVSAAAAADPPNFGRARAVALYDGVLREMIQDFKFRDRLELRPLFARWLADAGRDLLSDRIALLIPVPMTWWGLVARRFNQAAVLAHDLGRLCSLQVDTRSLVRRRHKVRQVRLTRAQRQDNVRASFAVAPRRVACIRGQRIVLVDDVITTGATARACTAALLGAGAASVDVLALGLVADVARPTV